MIHLALIGQSREGPGPRLSREETPQRDAPPRRIQWYEQLYSVKILDLYLRWIHLRPSWPLLRLKPSVSNVVSFQPLGSFPGFTTSVIASTQHTRNLIIIRRIPRGRNCKHQLLPVLYAPLLFVRRRALQGDRIRSRASRVFSFRHLAARAWKFGVLRLGNMRS